MRNPSEAMIVRELRSRSPHSGSSNRVDASAARSSTRGEPRSRGGRLADPLVFASSPAVVAESWFKAHLLSADRAGSGVARTPDGSSATVTGMHRL
jgi:hypothetical protein